MKKYEPTISIMIPTYNRSKILSQTLLALNKVEYSKNKVEIIVVDDGSTDDTQEVLKKTIPKVKFKTRGYWQENKKLCAARNHAISKSKNEIIVSIDDDMLFEKDWLKLLVEPFKDKKIGATGGPAIAPKEGITFLARACNHVLHSMVASGGILGGSKKSLSTQFPNGGNMAVPKKVLDEVGWFDEHFRPGEDLDLDYRILRAGYKLKYIDEAFVWHLPRANIKGFIKQLFSWGYVKIKQFYRYPEYKEKIYFMPSIAVMVLLILFFASFLSTTIRTLTILIVSLYLLMALYSGVTSLKELRRLKAIPLVFFLTIVQHIAYGLGFIAGSFNIRVKYIEDYYIR